MASRDVVVAFAVPEPWTSELQGWRERLGDHVAAGIAPHVTLLPPTSLPEQALPEFEDHLRAVAAAEQPFAMHLRGAATFRPVSPVVFVPLVRGGTQCHRVQTSIRSGPLARELDFGYHPHVTVAHDLPEPALDDAVAALATYEAQFTVRCLTLYEQDPLGSWRAQQEFPLGTAARVAPYGHRCGPPDVRADCSGG